MSTFSPTRRHPLAIFLVIAVGLTWGVQLTFLVNGRDFTPALLIELVVLLGTATAVTAWTSGRAGVRALFAGLVRWRISVARYVLVLAAMPALTLAIGAATGTLHPPDGGWLRELAVYLFTTVVFGALLGNAWEETAWAGFVQRRLMARHGLLRGSLLTAVPFFAIHLPLVFAERGWRDTTWAQAAVNLALLAAAAPFFRYLAGAVLVDTGGSVLAVALVHASFNASGSLTAVAGWQYLPAMVVLTLLVAGHRAVRDRTRARTALPAQEGVDLTGDAAPAGTR